MLSSGLYRCGFLCSKILHFISFKISLNMSFLLLNFCFFNFIIYHYVLNFIFGSKQISDDTDSVAQRHLELKAALP